MIWVPGSPCTTRWPWTTPSRLTTELGYAGSVVDAAADADVLPLLTEWREFTEADPEILGKVVAQRNMADGRNALDEEA